MKLSITSKLFLAILAANIAIAVAVGMAERVSFDRGFREYMREREAERLTGVADALATAWRTEGSFEFLRDNDMLWQRMNRGGREGGGPPDRPRGPSDAMRDRSPMGEHSQERGPPPGSPPGRDAFDRPPPRPSGGGGRDGPQLPTLLDAQQRRVVGVTGATALPLLRPVIVDGKTVGWLAGAEMREPFSGAERRLQEQQAKASWIIGGLAILLAALVAYLLARGFLAPLKRLASATHRIAAGDYATRVTTTSSDELGQLVADFNRLAQTLEANEAMRRHFMADVSHELRTPLAILRGELEALEDGIRRLTPERLKSLQAEVATLGKLVDDLYDLSLADVGALAYHKEDVDMIALVETALRVFRERFAARALAVDAPLEGRPAIVVHGDPDRLRQVMVNLFENCARYTDPGGRLRVAVERAGGNVHVDVMDSAPGVPPELLPRLFERLFRVESSRNRGSGGAGLGLSLSRSIVAGHDGEIRAQASPLGGLWIRITLPLANR
jgi:two-component system sensor histidine kinase BaeS